MADKGGFFKGEKKKKKKGEEKSSFSVAPTFTLPKVIAKGKKAKEQ